MQISSAYAPRHLCVHVVDTRRGDAQLSVPQGKLSVHLHPLGPTGHRPLAKDAVHNPAGNGREKPCQEMNFGFCFLHFQLLYIHTFYFAL